jgi:hypothetical protein
MRSGRDVLYFYSHRRTGSLRYIGRGICTQLLVCEQIRFCGVCLWSRPDVATKLSHSSFKLSSQTSISKFGCARWKWTKATGRLLSSHRRREGQSEVEQYGSFSSQHTHPLWYLYTTSPQQQRLGYPLIAFTATMYKSARSLKPNNTISQTPIPCRNPLYTRSHPLFFQHVDASRQSCSVVKQSKAAGSKSDKRGYTSVISLFDALPPPPTAIRVCR